MQTLVNRVIVLSLAILVWAGQGLACYQTNHLVHLRTHTLSGIVTLNGEPVERALLRLFRSDAGASVLVGNMDISAKRRTRVSEVTTAGQRKFSFGEVSAERYVIVTSDGSTEVEVTQPSEGESDTLVINCFGMGCQSASVIPPNDKIEL